MKMTCYIEFDPATCRKSIVCESEALIESDGGFVIDKVTFTESEDLLLDASGIFRDPALFEDPLTLIRTVRRKLREFTQAQKEEARETLMVTKQRVWERMTQRDLLAMFPLGVPDEFVADTVDGAKLIARTKRCDTDES